MHLRLLSSFFGIAVLSFASVSGSGLWPVSSDIPSLESNGFLPNLYSSVNSIANQFSAPFLFSKNYDGAYNIHSFGGVTPNPAMMMFLGDPVSASFDANQAMTLIANSQNSQQDGEPCDTKLNEAKLAAEAGRQQITATANMVFDKIISILSGMSGLPTNPFQQQIEVSLVSIIYSPLYYFCTGNMPGSASYASDVSNPTLSSIIWSMDGYLFWNPMIGWNNEQFTPQPTSPVEQPDPSAPKNIFSFLKLSGSEMVDSSSFSQMINPFSNFGTRHFNWDIIFGRPNTPDSTMPDVSAELPQVEVPSNLAIYFYNGQIPIEFTLFCQHLLQIVRTVKLSPDTMKCPPALLHFFPHANVPAAVLQFIYQLVDQEKTTPYLPMNPKLALYFPGGEIPSKFLAIIMEIMQCSAGPIEYSTVSCEITEFFEEESIPKEVNNYLHNLIYVYCGPESLTEEDREDGDYPPYEEVTDLTLPDEVDQAIPDEQTKKQFIVFLIHIVPYLESPGKIPIDFQIGTQLDTIFHNNIPLTVLHFIKHLIITWGKPVPKQLYPSDMNPEDIQIPEDIMIYFRTPEEKIQFRQLLIIFTIQLDQPKTNRLTTSIPEDFNILFQGEIPTEVKKFLKIFILYWHKGVSQTPNEETSLLPENTDETPEEGTTVITTPEGSLPVPTDFMIELTNTVDNTEIPEIFIFMITIVKKMKDPKNSITPDIAFEMIEEKFPDCSFIFEKYETVIKNILIIWKKKIPTPTEETELLPENTDSTEETTEQPEDTDESTDETPEEGTTVITTPEGSLPVPTDFMIELTNTVDNTEIPEIFIFMITIVKKMKDPKNSITPDIAFEMIEEKFPDCSFIFEKYETVIKNILIIWKKKIPTPTEETELLPENTDSTEETTEQPEDTDENTEGTTEQPEDIDESTDETPEEGTTVITTPEGTLPVPTDFMIELTNTVDNTEIPEIFIFMITIVKKMKDPKNSITPDIAFEMIEEKFPDCSFIFEKYETVIKNILIIWKKKIPTPTEETELLPENTDSTEETTEQPEDTDENTEETTEQPEDTDESTDETPEEGTTVITTPEGTLPVPTDFMIELTNTVDTSEIPEIFIFMITIVKKMKDPKNNITPDIAFEIIEQKFPDCSFIFEKYETVIKNILITWKKKIPTPIEESQLLPENTDSTEETTEQPEDTDENTEGTTEQPEDIDESTDETPEEGTTVITTPEGTLPVPTDFMIELTNTVDNSEIPEIFIFMITIVKKMKDPKNNITPDIAFEIIEQKFPDCSFIFEKYETVIKNILITWKKKIPTPIEESQLLPENTDSTEETTEQPEDTDENTEGTTEQPEDIDESTDETPEEGTTVITTPEGTLPVPTDFMIELTNTVDNTEIPEIFIFMITIVKKMKDPKNNITPDIAFEIIEQKFPDCSFIFEKYETVIKNTLITWKKKIPTPTEESQLLPENTDSTEETTEQPEGTDENTEETTEQPDDIDESTDETPEEGTTVITTPEGTLPVPTDFMIELTNTVDNSEIPEIFIFMITIVKKMKDPKNNITPDIAFEIIEQKFPDCSFIFEKYETVIKNTLITWKKKIPTPTEETELLPENTDSTEETTEQPEDTDENTEETTEQPEDTDESTDETPEEGTTVITTPEGTLPVPTDFMIELTNTVDNSEIPEIFIFMITIVKKMKDPKNNITPDIAFEIIEQKFPDCSFIFEKYETVIKNILITWKKKIPTPMEESQLLPENTDSTEETTEQPEDTDENTEETTEQPEDIDESTDETPEEGTTVITTPEGTLPVPTDFMIELTNTVDNTEIPEIFIFMITIVKKMKDPKNNITPDIAFEIIEQKFPDCSFIFEKYETVIKNTLITWKKKIPTPTEETELLPENTDSTEETTEQPEDTDENTEETTEQPEDIDESTDETPEEGTSVITTPEGTLPVPTDFMIELTNTVDNTEIPEIFIFMITIVKKMKDPKNNITPDIAFEIIEQKFPDCSFIFEKYETVIKNTLITWKKKIPTPTEESQLLPENTDSTEETTEQPEDTDENTDETPEEGTTVITTEEGTLPVPTDFIIDLTNTVDNSEIPEIFVFMITIVKKMKDPKNNLTPDIAFEMIEQKFPDCSFIFEKYETVIKNTLITWKKKIPTPTEESQLLPENTDSTEETTEQPEDTDENTDETPEEGTTVITTEEGTLPVPTDFIIDLTNTVDNSEIPEIFVFMITIVKKMKDPKNNLTPDIAFEMIEQKFPDCSFIFEKYETVIKNTLITWKKKIPTPTEESQLLPENTDSTEETTEQPEDTDESTEETIEENTTVIETEEGTLPVPTDFITDLTNTVDNSEILEIFVFMITIVKKMKDPKNNLTPDIAFEMIEQKFPDCSFILEKFKTVIKNTLITWKKKIPTPIEESQLLPENTDSTEETTEQPEDTDESTEETIEENTTVIETEEGTLPVPTDFITDLTNTVDNSEIPEIFVFMITIVKKMKDPKNNLTPDIAFEMIEQKFPDCSFILEKFKTVIKNTLITWKKKIPTPIEESQLLPENIDSTEETTEQPEDTDESTEETIEENTTVIETEEGTLPVPTDFITDLTNTVDNSEIPEIFVFMITIVKKMKDPKNNLTPDIAFEMIEQKFPDCSFILEKFKTVIKNTLITWKKKIPTPIEESQLLPENTDSTEETTEQPVDTDESTEETIEENTTVIETEEGTLPVPTDFITDLTNTVDNSEIPEIFVFMITIVKKMKDPKNNLTPDIAFEMIEQKFPDCSFILEKFKTVIKNTLITWKKKIPTTIEESQLLPENTDSTEETTEQPVDTDESTEETIEENTTVIETEEGTLPVPTDFITDLTNTVDNSEIPEIFVFMITIVKKMKDPKNNLTPDIAFEMIEQKFPDCSFILEKFKTVIKNTLITWKKKIPTPIEESQLLPENTDSTEETTEQPEDTDESTEETIEENTTVIETEEGTLPVPTDFITDLTNTVDNSEIPKIFVFMITIVKKMKDPKNNLTPDIAFEMIEQKFPDCSFILEKFKTVIKNTLITWKKKIPTPIEESQLLPENIDSTEETTEQPEDTDESTEETIEENTTVIETEEGTLPVPTDFITDLTNTVDNSEIPEIFVFMITIVKKMKDPKNNLTPDIAFEMIEQKFPDCSFILEKFKTVIKNTLITWKKKIPTPIEESQLLPENTDSTEETTEQPVDTDESTEETIEENTTVIETEEGTLPVPTDFITDLTNTVDNSEIPEIFVFMITIVKKMKDPKNNLTPDIAFEMIEQKFPDCSFILEKFKTVIKNTLITWKKKIPTPIEESQLLPENTDSTEETTEQPVDTDESTEETIEENTTVIETEEGTLPVPTDFITDLTNTVDNSEIPEIFVFMITIVKKMKDPKNNLTPDIAFEMIEQKFPDCSFILEKFKTVIKNTLITWKKKIPTPIEESQLLPENTDSTEETTEQPEDTDESTEETIEENTTVITTPEGSLPVPTDFMIDLTNTVDNTEMSEIFVFMITIVKKMKDPKNNLTPDIAFEIIEQKFPDCSFIFEKYKTVIKNTLITWKKKIPTPDEETNLLPENTDENFTLIKTGDGSYEFPSDFITDLNQNVDESTAQQCIFFMITIYKKMKDPKNSITPEIAFDIMKQQFPEYVSFIESRKITIVSTFIRWNKLTPKPTDEKSLLPDTTPNLDVPDSLRFSFKNNEIPPKFYIFLSSLKDKLKTSSDQPEIDIPEDVLESMNDEEPSEEVIDYLQEFISYWIEHIEDGPVDYSTSIPVPPELGVYFEEGEIPKIFFEFLRDIAPSGKTTIPISEDGELDLNSVINIYFPGGLHPAVIQFVTDCIQEWDRKLSTNLVPIQPVPGAPSVEIPQSVLELIPRSKMQLFQIILQNLGQGGRFVVKFDPQQPFTFPQDCMRYLLYIFRGTIPDTVTLYLQQYVTTMLNKTMPSQTFSIPGEVLKYIPEQNRQKFAVILKQMVTQYRTSGVFETPYEMNAIFPSNEIPIRIIWFLKHIVTGVPDIEEDLVPGDVNIVYPPNFEQYFDSPEACNSFKVFFITLAPHGSNELKPNANGVYPLPSRILTFFKDNKLPPAVHTFIVECISHWFYETDSSEESEETDDDSRLFSVSIPDSVLKEFTGGKVPEGFITYIQELSPNGKNPATISPDGSVGIPPGLEVFFPNGIPKTVINFVVQIAIQSSKISSGQSATGNPVDLNEIQITPEIAENLGGNPGPFFKVIQQLVTAGEKPATITPDGQIIFPPAVTGFFPDGMVPPPVKNFLIQLTNSWNQKENSLGFTTDSPLGFITDSPLGFITEPPLGFITEPPLGFITEPPLGFITEPPLGFITEPPLGFITEPPLGFITEPPLGSNTDPTPGDNSERNTDPPIENVPTQPPSSSTEDGTPETPSLPPTLTTDSVSESPENPTPEPPTIPTDSPTPFVPSDKVDVGVPVDYTDTDYTDGTITPNDNSQTVPPALENEYPDEPTSPGEKGDPDRTNTGEPGTTDNGTSVPGQPNSGSENPNQGGNEPPKQKVDESEETTDYPDDSSDGSDEYDPDSPNDPTKGQPGNPNTGQGSGGHHGTNGNGGTLDPGKNGHGGGAIPDKNGHGGGAIPDKNGNGGSLNTDKNGNGGSLNIDKNGSGATLNVGKGGGDGSSLNVGKGGGSGSALNIDKGGGSGSQYEIAKGGGSGSQYEIAKGGGSGSQYEVMKGGGGASSYTVGTGGGAATAWTKKVKLNQKQIDKIVTKHNKARSEIAQGLFADGSLTVMEPATNMKALVWDTDLVKSAAKQAQRCDGKFVKQTKVGENIYVNSTVTDLMKPPNLMADAVDSWKGELVQYPWNNSTDINLIARGLQLAWAKADKVGCAGHQCDSGMVLNVVCHYNNKPDPLTVDTYAKKGKNCVEYSKKSFNKKSGLCE